MSSPAFRVALRRGAAIVLLLVAVAHGAERFVIESNPFVVGQAADWLDGQHVVWHEASGRDEDADGQINIYSSRLDGSEKVCLTCGLPGRHQVPAVQPDGRWILFHSWSGRAVTVGGPGFGGIGSDVWVMTRDGGQRTNLTHDRELTDHFHAYWSPDGRYIVWTALDWNGEGPETGKSDVRVARFDPTGPNGPRLVSEHAVRPRNGHWYETQWWAPDGSGFLYTETTDTAVNPELFFCRLPDRAHGKCRPQRLTRNAAWDEQAIFAPDMSRIVFMSSRELPGAHNDWAVVSRFLDLPADYDFALVLSVFSNNFLQPKLGQTTDLWEMPLLWNAAHTRFKPGRLRRLTRTGEQGWIIPEFAWDPSGTRLLWTQNKFDDARRLDQGCLQRMLRERFLTQLQAVDRVARIPLGLDETIRAEAAQLLLDPRTYPPGNGACGGTEASPATVFEQQTKIGRFVGDPVAR